VTSIVTEQSTGVSTKSMAGAVNKQSNPPFGAAGQSQKGWWLCCASQLRDPHSYYILFTIEMPIAMKACYMDSL